MARALRASSVRHRLAAAVTIADRERRRLTRDVHDVSGQYIVSMLFQLCAMERIQAEPSLLPALVELRKTLTRFSEDLHGIASGARLGVPSGAGLSTGLANLVDEWERQIGIAARFRHHGLARAGIDDRTAEAAFRIAQEGLTNIAKHAASATMVTISLGVKADVLTLKIVDDGVAPAPGARHEESPLRQRCGLAGMVQRAEELGGTVSIRPRRGRSGTRLLATLPLRGSGPPAHGDGAA
jgi:signal transduction histidine kinase